jgi:hypothetical protein
MVRRSRSDFENSVLRGRSDLENRILERVGRSTTPLTVDDVGEVLGDALRAQRQQILAHVSRMWRLQELTAGDKSSDQRYRNLHRRLIEVEAEIRALKRGGSR